jgi:hypothetical protein
VTTPLPLINALASTMADGNLPLRDTFDALLEDLERRGEHSLACFLERAYEAGLRARVVHFIPNSGRPTRTSSGMVRG